MNIRHFLTMCVLSAAALVFASEVRAQYRPLPVIPIIQPVRPEPICVPIYRPITLPTPTLIPAIPAPRPAPLPAPRPRPR